MDSMGGSECPRQNPRTTWTAWGPSASGEGVGWGAASNRGKRTRAPARRPDGAEGPEGQRPSACLSVAWGGRRPCCAHARALGLVEPVVRSCQQPDDSHPDTCLCWRRFSRKQAAQPQCQGQAGWWLCWGCSAAGLPLWSPGLGAQPLATSSQPSTVELARVLGGAQGGPTERPVGTRLAPVRRLCALPGASTQAP